MACFQPLLAVDLGVDSETGKHRVKILPRRSDGNLESYRSKYGKDLMMLPVDIVLRVLKIMLGLGKLE